MPGSGKLFKSINMIKVAEKTKILHVILEIECLKVFGKTEIVLISELLPTNNTKSKVILPNKKEIEGDSFFKKEEADIDAIQKALKELFRFNEINNLKEEIEKYKKDLEWLK